MIFFSFFPFFFILKLRFSGAIPSCQAYGLVRWLFLRVWALLWVRVWLLHRTCSLWQGSGACQGCGCCCCCGSCCCSCCRAGSRGIQVQRVAAGRLLVREEHRVCRWRVELLVVGWRGGAQLVQAPTPRSIGSGQRRLPLVVHRMLRRGGCKGTDGFNVRAQATTDN